MNNSRIENGRILLDYLMHISEGEWVVKRDKILELRDEILHV
jgi:hypothetical protein